jgi:hypothetical protein
VVRQNEPGSPPQEFGTPSRASLPHVVGQSDWIFPTPRAPGNGSFRAPLQWKNPWPQASGLFVRFLFLVQSIHDSSAVRRRTLIVIGIFLIHHWKGISKINGSGLRGLSVLLGSWPVHRRPLQTLNFFSLATRAGRNHMSRRVSHSACLKFKALCSFPPLSARGPSHDQTAGGCPL